MRKVLFFECLERLFLSFLLGSMELSLGISFYEYKKWHLVLSIVLFKSSCFLLSFLFWCLIAAFQTSRDLRYVSYWIVFEVLLTASSSSFFLMEVGCVLEVDLLM